MDHETADELRAIERHRLLAVAVSVILPAEADLAAPRPAAESSLLTPRWREMDSNFRFRAR